MITLSMTAGKASDIIWIVRIDMDGTYFYFSTEYDKLTLDGVDFDGKVIDIPGQMEEGIIGNAVDGGSTSIVSNFTFNIKRFNNYTNVSNFINDFYPATGGYGVVKPLLTSKTVDVGIVWRGATTLAEITWLKQYYIQDPKFYTNRIECLCVEYDELANNKLPFYQIQKDANNNIDYFPNAPDESFGKPIPIIYGNFASAVTDLIYGNYNFTPAIRIDKTNNDYVICSHRCFAVGDDPAPYMFKFISEAKTMMYIVGVTSSSTNERRGHKISLSTAGSIISGYIDLLFTKIIASGYFEYIDANCIDLDPDTYTVVPNNKRLAFQLGYNLSDIGSIYRISTAVEIWAVVKSNDANNQLVTLGTYYSNVGADNDPAGYLLAPDSDGYATPTKGTIATTIGETKTSPDIPFTVNDLTDRYFILNTDVMNSSSINLYHIYVRLNGIKVYDDRQLQGFKMKIPKISIHIGNFK